MFLLSGNFGPHASHILTPPPHIRKWKYLPTRGFITTIEYSLKTDGIPVQLSSERLPPVAYGSRCRDPRSDITQTLNCRSPLGLSPQRSMNPAEREKRLRERMEDTRRTWPKESTKQDSQRLNRQAPGLYESAPESLSILWLLASSFCGPPNSGNGCISDSFACS